MTVSELAIRRPVAAVVLALLLLVLGGGAALRLPVRELPEADPPIVSVSVVYPGASAEVVERDVTQVIEDGLSGIDDVEQIRSTSRAAFSQIDIEFSLSRDLDIAASDVRERVSAVRRELPEAIEEPVVSKAAAEAESMMWITLTSPQRDRKALTDFAIRNLVDRLAILPGVAQVLIGGERRYAMRVWLDKERMAARGVTVSDVLDLLREENIEPPAGRIERKRRELEVRLKTKLSEPEAFADLVVRAGANGAGQVRLGDVARVELGAESYRSAVYESGTPATGLGIVRQSGSNTLAVARRVRAELERLRDVLPADIELEVSYDQSIFIEASIRGVVQTLLITAALVVVVIYLFLGSLRGTLVPAATIPSSLVACFAVLYGLEFSINTLTLLALVLAIGLVVDDAIVVLENVVRYRERGDPGLAAGVRGAEEVVTAVIATTAVLVAVLLPIAAMRGTVGRLFTEFSITLAAALVFSSLLALTLGAMLSSRLAEPTETRRSAANPLHWVAIAVAWLEERYRGIAQKLVDHAWVSLVLAVVLGAAVYGLWQALPAELAPTEDRAAFIIPVEAPAGASLEETTRAVRAIEAVLEPYMGEDGPVEDIISIAGIGRVGPPQVTQALLIVKLRRWTQRAMTQTDLVGEITPAVLAVPGAQAVPVNPASLVPERFGKPIQLVVSAPTYDLAREWAQRIYARAAESGRINQLDVEFDRETPQVELTVDRRLAADLGLSVRDIGTTLRIFMGGDDVTDFYLRGETYEVMVRGEGRDRDARGDLETLNVRSRSGELVPLASVVDSRVVGRASEYRRIDRQPSVVVSGVPAPGNDLGSILADLEGIAREEIPATGRIAYLGLSQEYRESSAAIFALFGLALVVVHLTLSALFESFVYPIVILAAVPLAVAGGLAALLVTGATFNIYSQIGLLILVGLLAKNAILVVDFANQRRRQGKPLDEAIVAGATTRFRPVLMTSVATFFGVIPLVLATGAGAEGRSTVGIVMLAGVVVSTAITLLIVPGLYRLVAGIGGVPGGPQRAVDEQLQSERPENREEREEESP